METASDVSENQGFQRPLNNISKARTDFISEVLHRGVESFVEQLENAPDEDIMKIFDSLSQSESEAVVLKRFAKETYHIASQLPTFALSEAPSKPKKIIYGEYYTTGEVAQMLNVQINTVKRHVADNKLIGYKVGNRTKLPTWQFDGNTVVSGIDTAIREIGANGVKAVRKMTLPLTDFEGKTVIEKLFENDIDTALLMIESIKE
ncbi:helix-turn-helix domain-containing protein [Agaribacter flavus]|uniref:Helix-turn-helix domain-containing protein n=1 Tax=Agaribacter flavus TaxID=1902781 RepID=A0ABV7FV34_9ALTE